MFTEYKAEKISILIGICIVASGCSFIHPGFGLFVLGIGTIAFGIGNWIVKYDETH